MYTYGYRGDIMNYRKHKLYSVYRAILARCYNPKCKSYKNYGARGILNEFTGYKEFIDWSLSNGYEEGLEIDRRDNNKNYSIDNCRWVTKSLNNKNRRCTSSCGYHGVSEQKSGKFKARLGSKIIGYYSDPKEAAIAYDSYIKENMLENKINFL